ncbi:MAG: hypothetical protein ACI353_07100 [Alloprevotella sp.]
MSVLCFLVGGKDKYISDKSFHKKSKKSLNILLFDSIFARNAPIYYQKGSGGVTNLFKKGRVGGFRGQRKNAFAFGRERTAAKVFSFAAKIKISSEIVFRISEEISCAAFP